ncbi:MAG TPA: hypothetical protein VIK54_04860, partial [Acidimicrobiia bacterium]
LREFRQLGRDLRAVGRFHTHRRAQLSGPFPFIGASVAPRVLISEAAVPYRPNLGLYVEVEEAAADEDPADVERIGTTHLSDLCAQPGVAGAWSFADEGRRIFVAWLDAAPLELNDRLVPVVARRRAESTGRTTFAGPFETIAPWDWTWFDTD